MSMKNDQAVSEIDRAIQAAQARKAAKTNKSPSEPKAPKPAKAAKPVAEPKRPRMTDEEKTARETARAEERAVRKANRDAIRAEKLAARNASKSPAHMAKVSRAAEKLGVLSADAQMLFGDATSNLPAAQVAILASHLSHFNRVKATERALTQAVEAGQTVTIVGGDPRYVGKTGTVIKAQRIRCYVSVEGVSKPIYLFTSDVEVLSATNAVATA